MVTYFNKEEKSMNCIFEGGKLMVTSFNKGGKLISSTLEGKKLMVAFSNKEGLTSQVTQAKKLINNTLQGSK